jgi:hypothetical protein
LVFLSLQLDWQQSKGADGSLKVSTLFLSAVVDVFYAKSESCDLRIAFYSHFLHTAFLRASPGRHLAMIRCFRISIINASPIAALWNEKACFIV